MNERRRKNIERMQAMAQEVVDAIDQMIGEETDENAADLLQTAGDALDTAIERMREACDVGRKR